MPVFSLIRIFKEELKAQPIAKVEDLSPFFHATS